MNHRRPRPPLPIASLGPPEAQTTDDEWLWGWDPTPGIVSVWAEATGSAIVWRRSSTGQLSRETDRFRPWVLLDRLDDLRHLGRNLTPEEQGGAGVSYRELDGPGALRYLVSADHQRTLTNAILHGASGRLARSISHLRDLGTDAVLALPLEEQYLVASGRTYFRDLSFDELHRLQFDLETTGLDPERHRIFMVAVRDPGGDTQVLEVSGRGDAAEADLIRRLVASVLVADPDVIENHNLQGFDLPFLERRARRLGVPLGLGRVEGLSLRQRAARRGTPGGRDSDRRYRFVIPGRELIDTLDAVRGYDFATRELPGHGLKAVARHLGIARPDRVYLPGDRIATIFRDDPERVRRYATDDVEEVAALARMLGGAAFALAQMAPRRYERLADAGPATGVIDPLLVRAYLRRSSALPAHQPSDGTPHSGAALHLFATGVAHRVVKADVASLYPSLMRAHRIGPSRDRLGALLAMVDRLVDQRLAAKARARAAPPDSAERHTHEAMSAAMKLVVNSAYGYLAADGLLTRFADVHAANEVTRRGRETLALICRELANRGTTLLEADTDGVYFSVPSTWNEADERRVVEEVAALLPDLVQLEFEGRYAAMLSHEPKNYALLRHDGALTLRGVAFRSARSEPFGETFLRRAIAKLLVNDVPGVREAYLDTVAAIRQRALPTADLAARVRLTKTPEQYRESRESRREFGYEAVIASGRTTWRRGERVRVYRRPNGVGALAPDSAAEPNEVDADPRDYDVDHYVRLLRDTFAARLARAFTPEDLSTVLGDPDQPSLFASSPADIVPVLTAVPGVQSGVLPDTWYVGGPDDDRPDFLVHEYTPDIVIFRQAARTSFEKPFLYLIFGSDRAVLFDTGAGGAEVADAVDQVVRTWLARRRRTAIPLIVAHTHGHADHTAGDDQFRGRPGTTLVAPDLASVQRFWGIDRWPEQTVTFDLGGRVLDIIPIPGHDPTGIAVYDRQSRTMLTGDTFYPGRLYVRDGTAFTASIRRLVEFSRDHPVAHFLGTHIENRRQPFRDYPEGTVDQPDEHVLQLGRDELIELYDALRAMDGTVTRRILADQTTWPVED